jgi:flagellar protein FlaI
MADFGTPTIGDELENLADKHIHLKHHLDTFYGEHNQYPLLIDEPGREYESNRPNVIYPVGDTDEGIFVHIFGDRGIDPTYSSIEPELLDGEEEYLDRIKERILKLSSHEPAPTTTDEFIPFLDTLLDRVVLVDEEQPGVVDRVKGVSGYVRVPDESVFERIRYRLHRDIAGLGPLDPIMKDPENEDIHVIGADGCFVDHGTYGMLQTNITFGHPDEFDSWLRNIGERINNPVSDAEPIIDNTLPDGSRINIIYSDDVSVKGPAFTVRQGKDVPLSIFQLTAWETLSPELAAYLWLALENEQTVFVVGETASGKTTTLNACMSFIPLDSKIYTAEDTAEVQPPHETWQQNLTRETAGGEGSTDVDMFDLVAAALRSRPDYIICGEVRGPETQMAFQAAQTGHPVMLTFHASDIKALLQRLTGEPINVPETFLDNCDIALFQNRVKRGDEMLRRVTSVVEIEGYSKEAGGVVTREVFNWDPAKDEIVFQGQNNSYVLEEQIATLLGYEDTSKIYNELLFRAELIRRFIDADIVGYDECNEAIQTFRRDGAEALSVDVASIKIDRPE